MSEELRKEVADQIQHLEIQKGIIECKDFLNDEDNELISNINTEIRKLKAKL